jgi:hypothetical protein
MVSVTRLPNSGRETCDGCGAEPPELSVLAAQAGASSGAGYEIGLRLCDDCRSELRGILCAEPWETGD